MRFAEVADLVLILADPVSCRYSLREVQMYAQLLSSSSAHRAKTHICAWLTDKMASDPDLSKQLDRLQAVLKKQVGGWDDTQLEVCHAPNVHVRGPKLANCLDIYLSRMTTAVDAYINPLLTKVQTLIRRALNLVSGSGVDPNKQDMLLKMLRDKASQMADKKDVCSWRLHTICKDMSSGNADGPKEWKAEGVGGGGQGLPAPTPGSHAAGSGGGFGWGDRSRQGSCPCPGRIQPTAGRTQRHDLRGGRLSLGTARRLGPAGTLHPVLTRLHLGRCQQS